MSWKYPLVTLLALAHLTAVVCGASHFAPSATPVGRVYRTYAVMSGACNSYGFFAPQVGARHRAKFTLRDANDHTWSDVFDDTHNPEARLRLSGMVEDPFMTGQTGERPEMRKRLIRSWGATMLTRHPTAESVIIEIEARDIPSITEIRESACPGWTKVYQAQVQRQAFAKDEVSDE